jgi:hypothetical protein
MEMVEHKRKQHKTEIMAISTKENNVIVAGDRNGNLSVWSRDTYVHGSIICAHTNIYIISTPLHNDVDNAMKYMHFI